MRARDYVRFSLTAVGAYRARSLLVAEPNKTMIISARMCQ